KKYRGSLSGEHGDGRLRGEFIPLMIGEHNYALLKQIKETWDPEGIFNPGKITATPSMNTSLRYTAGKPVREIPTVYNFSRDQGIIRAVERCNGSGDCRKTEIIGGTMCPSFMATRDERNTTRARANILREFLTNSTKSNPFDHKEIYEIMDLCLSCKACKSECPSNVDMAKLKTEFLQHYYDSNGIPLRTKAIAYITSLNRLMAVFPALSNLVMSFPVTGGLIKKVLKFAPDRSMPLLYKTTLNKWYRKHKTDVGSGTDKKTVYLFADEFTNYNDTKIGIVAIMLLERLGYKVIIPGSVESGRTFISKGLLRKAKKIAIKNVTLLKDVVTPEKPLIGIEPSAILSFRDEYPELVSKDLIVASRTLAKSVFTIEEFLSQEFAKGCISNDLFTKEAVKIKLHGHCQQKAVASTQPTVAFLQIPENYQVVEIPSGCCGMAGSFGFEKEHYDLSMKVGELVLFPTVRNMGENEIIAAPGTSCRHQIKDGTGRSAFHPVEIIYNALR
ncbi:MAG: FAD-binding oxidoreductase, partial [Bacteroidetes bacterium HGW-Bacteroidetes-22]